MARLSLSFLGPFQVALDGQPVTNFKSNKVRALLAYLAVEAERPHRREVLAGLLWPDWPDREALSNLRYALSDLRRAIGDRIVEPPFLLITRDALQFNPASDHRLDVLDFEFLTVEGRLPVADPESQIENLKSAIDMARGSFLEGFTLGDSAPFEEWALLTRERLTRQMSSALHNLATAFEQRGEYAQAQSIARRQLELEPWDEAAHQQLMRVLSLSGQRSAALAQYETCHRLLAEELGVEPSAETTRLYEQIRDEEFKVPAPVFVSRSDLAVELPSFLDGEESVETEGPVFVARERELAQLDSYLDAALAGQGKVVFVTGEAGSGKTALVQEVIQHAQRASSDLLAAVGNCNAHVGMGDPYLPFREILGLLTGDIQARWAAGAVTTEHARRLWDALPLTAEALVEAGPDLIDTFIPGAALVERATMYTDNPQKVPWLASLNELVERKPLRWVQDGVHGSSVPSSRQADLFEQYTQVLRTLVDKRPLLLVVDDLQWADRGSVDLLFHLGRRIAGSRILIVGAFRPAEVAIGRDGERHPLEPIVNEFKRSFGDIELDLEQAEGRRLVDALLDSEPNRLDAPFREMLYQQTLGHPLFSVELLRGMQERGDLVQDSEGRWVEGPALDWETLPARVEAAIAERIDRLAQPMQAAMRVASVEGESFTAEVVARVLGTGEREMVRRLSSELDRRHRLVRAQAIERLGARRMSHYRFRHNLFQQYLYDNLDPVERAYLHEDVGHELEGLYEGHAAERAVIAPQLARHFEEAGITEKAIHYLHQAGDRAAMRLSAYQEARAHLHKGLALFNSLPDSSERGLQELDLQLSLGMAWRGSIPNPEGEKYLARARELCQQMDKQTQLCRVLGELSIFPYVRAEHRASCELGEETLKLAQQIDDPLLVILSHWHLGYVLFALGEYTTAREHFQQVLSGYQLQEHHDSLVFLRGSDVGAGALAYDACCLWCLGYPEQASKRSQEALTLARELGHAFTLVDVLCFGGCVFNQMRRDAQAVKHYAAELIQISDEMGFSTFSPTGICSWGESLTKLGQVQEGIAQIRKGLAAKESVGAWCYSSGILGGLAEAEAVSGQLEEGLGTINEALDLVQKTDERYCEAELNRLRGKILLMQGDQVEAEASFLKAIEIAHRQQGKSWELRAVTDLASLWQAQGKVDEARQVLAKVYDWFTEGFDTRDLREARTLLGELDGVEAS